VVFFDFYDQGETGNMTQTGNSEAPKEASASVIARHAATLKALPFSDTSDFDDAARGFLGTLDGARITTAQGRVV
jgi:alkyl sulfatase BDS1-like metallo-beta-lactamase superfamily hydrolase